MRSRNRKGADRHTTGVCHINQSLPVSLSMPRDQREGVVVNRYGHKVREHADGTFSTMDGRRIVDTREAQEKHMAQCGYKKYDAID